MDDELPSEAELAVMAAQVDLQLSALQLQTTSRSAALRGKAVDGQGQLPAAPDQQGVIEQITGEPFPAFWGRYLRHARRDLCLPGGLLHEQWRKWRDLESRAAVRTSYVWLAAMGIPTASIAPLAVAATVFLLNVAVKVGIETICEQCVAEDAQEPASPEPKS